MRQRYARRQLGDGSGDRRRWPVRRGFLRSLGDLIDLVSQRNVAAPPWGAPSIIAGFSIGGLAGHLFSSTLTIERYLESPSGRENAVDSATYERVPR